VDQSNKRAEPVWINLTLLVIDNQDSAIFALQRGHVWGIGGAKLLWSAIENRGSRATAGPKQSEREREEGKPCFHNAIRFVNRPNLTHCLALYGS
jgi:hypothetical protein